MAHQDAFVSAVTAVRSEPAATPMSVSDADVCPVTWIDFQNGRRAWFDEADADAGGYRELVEALSVEPAPVYVSIDTATSKLAQILVPIVVRVVSLTERANGDIDVELRPSHAPHVIRAGNPDLPRLVAALEEARETDARVAVTEDRKSHDIRDVSPCPELPELGLANGPFEPAALADAPTPLIEVTFSFQTFAAPLTHVSEQRAQALFDELSSARCHPTGVRAPCIPFAYPTDGCHARAHLMCAILEERCGVTSGKIWLYGEFRSPYTVRTSNDPDCEVLWAYHVAPVVETTAAGESRRVLDPSLFSRPVTPDAWVDRQFSGGTVVFSNRHLFDRRRPNGTRYYDPDLRDTREALSGYRLLLIQQIRDFGRPPYC